MKKISLSIILILSSAIVFPTFADDDVDEVVVVGNRPGGSPWGSGGGNVGATPHNHNDADHGNGLADEKRRQACEAQVEAMKLPACIKDADSIMTADKNVCNAIAIGSSVVAGVSGVVLAGVGKPTNVKMAVLFGVAGVGATLSGAALTYATTTCKDNADNNYKFNQGQCANYVAQLQDAACP